MGPLGITLVADRLSTLMLVVSSIVLLAVVFYAIGQGIRDGNDRQPVSIFLPTYLILSAGVCTAFLAGDLFNLFVGFEVLLSASFVLLTIGGAAPTGCGPASLRDGVDGVVAGVPDRPGHGVRRGRHPEHGRARGPPGACAGRYPHRVVRGAAGGLRDQAAVFPLSAWLPESYPTAPAPP